jgi:pentatricopeptide repeat protein
MKKWMGLLLVIGVFCSFAYAEDDCDSEYAKLIDMLKNDSKFSAKDQEKYIPPLEEAYRLCKEGKYEEADKIVKDLKDKGLAEEAFSGAEGN